MDSSRFYRDLWARRSEPNQGRQRDWLHRVILDRIFDPFFTTKGVGDGTGLGLSVVHGIISDLGGRVMVESEPGHGAIFNIYLPIEENASNKVEPSPVIQHAANGERVLIVDDEPYLADNMQRSLQALGYRPKACTRSRQALEIFKNTPDAFDLIITDLTMPEMNGDELTRRILQIRKEIPIILCTGYSERISAAGRRLGFRTILYKPVLQWQMAEAIRHAL